MAGSRVRWAPLAMAAAVGAIWILSIPAAVAQQDGAARSGIEAKKEALDGAFEARSEENDDSARVQKGIDQISDQTDELAAQYRTVLKQIDSIDIYNAQLNALIVSQEKELASLQEQLDRVEEVGRSVTPLMLRMINALEATVNLDIPFLLDERSERVAKLRLLMTRAAVTNSEKYRMIMEAYQTENEYGRTIEAYRSSLKRGDREVKVDFLRFGRIALVYQTLDGMESGVWNHNKKAWEPLDASYRTAIREGLRIARKQAAPDLIRLPFPVPPKGNG